MSLVGRDACVRKSLPLFFGEGGRTVVRGKLRVGVGYERVEVGLRE